MTLRLVVTSDTHFPFDNSLIPDGDVFIHCGDLMYSGYVDEWNPVVESLAALPHKEKILIPGNHDFHMQNYNGIARADLRRKAGVRMLDDNDPMYKLANGMQIFAVPFVTGLPGWAWNRLEISLASYLQQWNAAPGIVMSHGPMYKVLDAVNPEKETERQRNHVGSWELAKWYHGLENKPELFFHGHIHESYGEHHEWGTSFYNVAMCDRDYNQVNPAIVIDI